MYVPFARGHGEAVRTLRAALARAEVARAIETIALSDERVRGEALEDLLALPLTRIGD
jgi:hypothetical protein